MVAVGDCEELVDAIQEADRVLLPEEMMQEDAHRVEAEGLCPSQLAVDGTRVERCRLPHFELVDRRAGNEIAANQPSRGIGPRPCVLLRPYAARWSACLD